MGVTSQLWALALVIAPGLYKACALIWVIVQGSGKAAHDQYHDSGNVQYQAGVQYGWLSLPEALGDGAWCG
jgi:hypothetical protein